jgi:hypothetical protein
MCFSSPAPPPPPPPVPIPPSARDENLRNQQDELRRQKAAAVTDNILTTPLGDPGFNKQTVRPQVGGGTSLG